MAVACFTFLSGNENNTIRTTRTIDSGGTSIFQYGNRLDILSRNIANIATCNTINYNQRGVAGGK